MYMCLNAQSLYFIVSPCLTLRNFATVISGVYIRCLSVLNLFYFNMLCYSFKSTDLSDWHEGFDRMFAYCFGILHSRRDMTSLWVNCHKFWPMNDARAHSNESLSCQRLSRHETSIFKFISIMPLIFTSNARHLSKEHSRMERHINIHSNKWRYRWLCEDINLIIAFNKWIDARIK